MTKNDNDKKATTAAVTSAEIEKKIADAVGKDNYLCDTEAQRIIYKIPWAGSFENRKLCCKTEFYQQCKSGHDCPSFQGKSNHGCIATLRNDMKSKKQQTC